jgi:hypothetical protein
MDPNCAKILCCTRSLAQKNCSRINTLASRPRLNPLYVYGNVGGAVGTNVNQVTFMNEFETSNIVWDAPNNVFVVGTDGLYTLSYSVPFGQAPGFTIIAFGINGIFAGAAARPGAESIDGPSQDNASVSGTTTLRLSAGDTIGVYIESVMGALVPNGPIGSFTVYSLQI